MGPIAVRMRMYRLSSSRTGCAASSSQAVHRWMRFHPPLLDGAIAITTILPRQSLMVESCRASVWTPSRQDGQWVRASVLCSMNSSVKLHHGHVNEWLCGVWLDTCAPEKERCVYGNESRPSGFA